MSDRRCLVALVLLHLAIVAIVQPRGEFPINDDWAYARSVQWLLDEGRLRLSDWVGMNLVPQTLAGGAVAAVAGFSFEALRHLTQTVALLAMAAAYFWFRSARFEPRAALVATAAVVAFPAWPVLANSYMTDLYGLALALPAATLFLRALKSASPAAIVAATAFSAAGVLERQVVLAVPFAFMAASLWTRRPLDRRTIAWGVVPFLAAAAAAAAFHAYLALGPGVPSGFAVQGRVFRNALKVLINPHGAGLWALINLANIFGYLAVFSVGWLAWWGMRGASRGDKVLAAACGAVLAAAAFAVGWFPPYRPLYVIDAAGIGPYLLYDAVRNQAPLDRDPGILWRGIAIPGAFAMAALFVCMVSCCSAVARRRRSTADPVTTYLVVLIIGYLVPFVLTDFFDRYLLYALPFLFVLWARWVPAAPSGWRRGLAAAWIAAAIVLSSVATRDYFSWQRARWQAIRTAERMGATAETLDGGFEYNAYRRFGEQRVPGKSWWYVADDRYVVAFSEVAGYDVVERWKVAHWLPRSPAQIVLLRRSR